MKTSKEIKQEAIQTYLEANTKELQERKERRSAMKTSFLETNFPDAVIIEGDEVELAGEIWSFDFRNYKGFRPTLSRVYDGSEWIIWDMKTYGEYCWRVDYDARMKAEWGVTLAKLPWWKRIFLK